MNLRRRLNRLRCRRRRSPLADPVGGESLHYFCAVLVLCPQLKRRPMMHLRIK